VGGAILSTSDPDDESKNLRRCSHLARSTCVDQLRIWTSLFPPEQILILRSENLFADPQRAYEKVLAHLRLPHRRLRNPRNHSQGNYEPMDPSVRQRLVEYFRPHNRRLAEFLGIEFEWDR
jgi:hypothetical protein